MSTEGVRYCSMYTWRVSINSATLRDNRLQWVLDGSLRIRMQPWTAQKQLEEFGNR